MAASPAAGYQATFTPTISVSEEYTDNYFLTDDNKEHEYITTISPAFTAQILGKSSGAEISYAPSYAIYDRFNENDYLRHSAQFFGWTEIAKNTRLDVSDSFLLTEEPLSEADIAILQTEDPTAQIDSTIRRSRQTYYTNSARVNLTHQFGESDSINLGYFHGLLENEDPSIEDNERYNPFLGLTHWFVPQWGIEMQGSYTKGQFDTEEEFEGDPSDDFNNWNGSGRFIIIYTRHFEGFIRYSHTYMDYKGETENYQIHNPSTGLNYTLPDDISLSFDIGYYIREMEESDNESGLNTSGSLTKTYRRGSINLTGSGGYEETFFGAENLGFSKFYEAGGSATYQLTRHISLNIFSSYRNNKYEDIEPEREDKTTRGGLGLTIQPLPWMTFELNYTYRSVDSTLDINDYEENRGLIRVTLSPSLPYRFAQ